VIPRMNAIGRSTWVRVALLLTLILFLIDPSANIAASFSPREEITETVDRPPGARSTSAGPVGERPSRNPKLDSFLSDVAGAAKISTEEAVALAESHSLRISAGRVHVQIVTHAPGVKAAIQAVTGAGGEVTGVAYGDTLIQGWLPVEALETVAVQDDVYFIRRPIKAYPLENLHVGNSTTEGLAVINGPAWHAAGYTGTGVKVGIIDAGFVGYPGLLGTDLPASVSIKNFVDGEGDAQVDGTTEHGTACAEVIHDLAPDAEIYLVKIGTDLDLAEAVDWLITQHVDIISTSFGFYNAAPGDGTGSLADLVSQARAAGVLWITAAGNDRVTHWGGAYDNRDDDNFHEFADGEDVNCFTFALFGGDDCAPIFLGIINLFVRWSDWDNVDQDYDVHIVRWNGTDWETVASSTNVQDGSPGQTPTEWVTAIIFDFAPYGFRIERVNGDQPVNFEVFTPGLISFGFGLKETVHARSLANLADSPGAVTVAALDVTSPYPQEFYSSEGPTNGPGGIETGGIIKPDISGFANVSTQSYGPGLFNGTSAATPHVAGAAALVLSAHPGLSPDQIQAFLQGLAIDMGSPSIDTQFGYGRLQLGDPPNAPPLHHYFFPLMLKQ
jgi:subtilisin family serine protease